MSESTHDVLGTETFDWNAVWERVQSVVIEELQTETILQARAIWERRAARGKTCRVNALVRRARQEAQRIERRQTRVTTVSEIVVAQQTRETVSLRLDRLSDRQRVIADALSRGCTQAECAELAGCSQQTVSRECAKIADLI